MDSAPARVTAIPTTVHNLSACLPAINMPHPNRLSGGCRRRDIALHVFCIPPCSDTLTALCQKILAEQHIQLHTWKLNAAQPHPWRPYLAQWAPLGYPNTTHGHSCPAPNSRTRRGAKSNPAPPLHTVAQSLRSSDMPLPTTWWLCL